MIKQLFNLLRYHGETDVKQLCNAAYPPVRTPVSGSCFSGFGKQDTPHGCNGDIDITGNNMVITTHTNPNHTAPDPDSWKENRVEIFRKTENSGIETNRKWKLNFRLLKMGETSNFVIISQWWNRTHDNVLSLVVQKSTKQPGKFKLRLDKKQNKKSSTLWSGYFDLDSLSCIDLSLINNTVSGSINGFNIGMHYVDLNGSKTHMELKLGAYWSNKIPYNKANQMIIEFENLDYSKI